MGFGVEAGGGGYIQNATAVLSGLQAISGSNRCVCSPGSFVREWGAELKWLKSAVAVLCSPRT